MPQTDALAETQPRSALSWALIPAIVLCGSALFLFALVFVAASLLANVR